MSLKPRSQAIRTPVATTNASLAVVFQVREGSLHVLLWERAREPAAGRWSLPGGLLDDASDLEASIRHQLAAKVDVSELAHLEQLATWSDPQRIPGAREIATAYLGLIRTDTDPSLPSDTAWHRLDGLPDMAFDHGAIVIAARERVRAKLSYTNVGFALAPLTFTLAELRSIYVAALGHDVSATNLRRVLERRRVIEPIGDRRPSGTAGGRPAEVYAFSRLELEITDPFATLRPPEVQRVHTSS